jgi:hypothetical protein
MNEPRLSGRLLTRLFHSGQAGETADIIGLARSCGSDVLGVLRAMAALERAGLADARRLRLTLSGLALAAALSGSEQTSPRIGSAGRAARSAAHATPHRRPTFERAGVLGLAELGR